MKQETKSEQTFFFLTTCNFKLQSHIKSRTTLSPHPGEAHKQRRKSWMSGKGALLGSKSHRIYLQRRPRGQSRACAAVQNYPGQRQRLHRSAACKPCSIS